MNTVSMKDAKNRLTALARQVETTGEPVTITRNGKPILDLVPHKAKKGGIDFEAIARYKREHGIDKIITYIAPDFDDPLPEDFLLQPLPDPPAD